MKNKIFDYLINMRSDFHLRADIGAPIREMQNEHANKILTFLEYGYNSSLKNIDVIIDLLKAFLSISGSILIAKYTITNFPFESFHLEETFFILIVLLIIFLFIRMKTSSQAVEKYKKFLQEDAKRIKEYGRVYLAEVGSNLKRINGELKIISKFFKEQPKGKTK